MVTLISFGFVLTAVLFCISGKYNRHLIRLMSGLLIVGIFIFSFMKYGPQSLWNNDNQITSYMIFTLSMFVSFIGGAGLIAIFISRIFSLVRKKET